RGTRVCKAATEAGDRDGSIFKRRGRTRAARQRSASAARTRRSARCKTSRRHDAQHRLPGLATKGTRRSSHKKAQKAQKEENHFKNFFCASCAFLWLLLLCAVLWLKI